MSKPLELLSPAGDFERLRAAIAFGADAVYLGGDRFGMRAGCGNFASDDLSKAVAYAHERGVKVHLTCNTMPTNNEVDTLPDFLASTQDAGVDALLVADMGVMALAHKYAPKVAMHISTQVGVVNYATASAFHDMGASRVVLARELSLDQIADIRAKTPVSLELEAFVHGAMCVSFSGRCLISSYLTGRDANRGECAQPCRWEYELTPKQKPDKGFIIAEEEGGTYLLNAKDLCMLEHLDKLAEAGIMSAKIEGRAKSTYYAAIITNAYRVALDAYIVSDGNYTVPQWALDEVLKVSHRPYSTGFYFGPPENGQATESGGYIRDYDVVALVDGWKDGRILASQRNRFFAGDELELLAPGESPVSLRVDTLYNGEGAEIESAPRAEMRLQIPCEREFPPLTIIRKQVSAPVNP